MYGNVITKIEASKRHFAKYEWLKTHYLFSFADYFDPMNLQFGVLRVFNDDTINAYSGFDEHGHENMEIVTIMLEGRLTHRDSLGNTVTIKAGEVQRMTAGTGVIHAEKNLTDEPVHLYQLWFLPNKPGLAPSYEQKEFSFLEKNRLTPIVSSVPAEGALSLAADAALSLGELETGAELSYEVKQARGVFIYVQSGTLRINNRGFSSGDQARISEEPQLMLCADTDAKFIFIDVGGI